MMRTYFRLLEVPHCLQENNHQAATVHDPAPADQDELSSRHPPPDKPGSCGHAVGPPPPQPLALRSVLKGQVTLKNFSGHLH